MREIWKSIPGWPGYQASNFGRVRSQDRTVRYTGGTDRKLQGKILAIHWRKRDGYGYVDFCVNGHRRCLKVHQLVAAAFKGLCPAGMEVRHKDGVKSHNVPGNLLYGTRANNESDKVGHGKSNRGERCGTAKLTRRQVLNIRGSNQSVAAAAEKYDVSRWAIYDIRSGKNWGWL